jgi:hypothetical protein
VKQQIDPSRGLLPKCCQATSIQSFLSTPLTFCRGVLETIVSWHSYSDILEHQPGDCKQKARALLLKIESTNDQCEKNSPDYMIHERFNDTTAAGTVSCKFNLSTLPYMTLTYLALTLIRTTTKEHWHLHLHSTYSNNYSYTDTHQACLNVTIGDY